MADTFIEKRKANWKRLEELIGRARGARGLRRFKREEVRELGRIYRRAASDLAIAREESRDQRLVNYLNSLVIRAHGEIYRTESKGAGAIFNFYRYEFPIIFRRTFRFTLTIFIIFLAVLAFSFVATSRNDDFSEFAYVPPSLVKRIKENKMWTDV